MPRQENTHESKAPFTWEDRLRHEKCTRLCHISGVRVTQEFQSLLRETDFISRVLDIYRRDARSRFRITNRYNVYGRKQPLSEFEEHFQRQENFIREYLPDRLYNLTDILMLEAIYTASGEPMLKTHRAELIQFVFIDRGPDGPPLKDGRNEVWNTHNLKWALSQVLPEIKVPGAVTLSTVAKKINELPKTTWLSKCKRPLSGKHLQKLFKEHDINWVRIKRDYIRRLACSVTG